MKDLNVDELDVDDLNVELLKDILLETMNIELSSIRDSVYVFGNRRVTFSLKAYFVDWGGKVDTTATISVSRNGVVFCKKLFFGVDLIDKAARMHSKFANAYTAQREVLINNNRSIYRNRYGKPESQ